MILQVPPWVCCIRGLSGELFFLSTVSLAEAVDLAVGIQLAHFAGPERMAGGRNVETDDGDLCPSTSRISFEVMVERDVHSVPVAESTKMIEWYSGWISDFTDGSSFLATSWTYACRGAGREGRVLEGQYVKFQTSCSRSGSGRKSRSDDFSRVEQELRGSLAKASCTWSFSSMETSGSLSLRRNSARVSAYFAIRALRLRSR